MTNTHGVDIKLRDITSNNWAEAAKLEVREDQKKFVTPNLTTIAESKFVPGSCSLLKGIYQGDTMIGFAWITYNIRDHSYRLVRFMIDAKFQGQGYGKLALLKILEFFKDPDQCFPAEKPIHLQEKDFCFSLVPEDPFLVTIYEKLDYMVVIEFIKRSKHITLTERDLNTPKIVYTSLRPENLPALALYKTIGFKETGKKIHHDIELRLVLD
ncbi:MAG: GNAT family N-acetyltransferase [Candidatus Hermodarchaeota archaeon]